MSANILVDPGAELDSPLWAYGNGGQRFNGFAFSGEWVFALAKTSPGIGGRIQQTAIAVDIGTTYRVRQWVNGQNADSKPLGVSVEGDTITHTDYGNWHIFDWGAFTATDTSASYLAFMIDTGSPGVHFWLVDDIFIQEDSVTIQLGYRAVQAAITMLRANLADELTATAADFGSFTPSAVANDDYYARPKAFPSLTTSQVWCEVYENTFTFEQPYSDAGNQRAVYDLPLTVRLTAINGRGNPPATMIEGMRQYAAALYNSFITNTDLGDADGATKVAIVSSVIPTWDIDPESDLVRKASVTLNVVVRCEEIYS